MNISGIRPNAGFYDYNYIKSSEIRSQMIEQAKGAEAGAGQNLSVDTKSAVSSADAGIQGTGVDSGDSGRSSAQNFGAYDYAQLYQPETDHEMKGADSDIKSLDMEKAISDMQKDQVLQQYQFFVGEKSGESGSIGAARSVENFNA